MTDPTTGDELLEVVLPAVTVQFGRKLETFAEAL